jgi:hypothetical protein
MSQQYPPQPPQQFAQGQLVLNLRKPMGLGSAALISPGVTIDGFPAPARWERNFYPVPAGRRTVAVESRYLWPYGKQQQVFDVAPGQTVEVHYSGPLVSFGAGAMGFTEQPRPGKLTFWLILAIPIALVVAIFVAIMASSLGS